MKGSVGVSAGVGARGVSVGARASGSATGPKAVSVSLSPEARFGGGSTAFSSRGLGKYNQARTASINIHFGKEAKPSFATNNALRSQKSMLDVSRPVVRGNISRSPQAFKVSGMEKGRFSNPNSIINIHNGKEAKSKTARAATLAPTRSMFDLNRSVSTLGKRTEAIKVNPLGIKSLPKDPVILWERQIKAVRRERFRVNPVQISTPKVETRFSTVATPVTFKDHVATRLRISPRSEVARAFELDVQQAEATVRAIDSVSDMRSKSYEVVTQALIRKYEGKPGVEVTPQVLGKTEANPKPQIKPQTMPQVKVFVKGEIQAEEEEDVKNKDAKKKPSYANSQSHGIRFYFMTHHAALMQRITGAVETARYLLGYKKEITGQDISYEMSKKSSSEYESEVISGVRADETYAGFLKKLSAIGTITDPLTVSTDIQIAASSEKPVRLSFSPEGEQVGQEGAAKVYRGPLEGERAYFRDNRQAYGKFRNGREKNEVWFIPDASNPISSVT